jgi:GntR family transcriptional regulator, rspAB operon transcriptional repressor
MNGSVAAKSVSRLVQHDTTGLGNPITPGFGRSMRLEVYQRLREAILSVTFRPGQAISENEIADMLQVSRTPIREALQRLANEELIHVVPQRGTFVARLDLGRIREALFMREAIECAALARIQSALAKAELQELQGIVADHRHAARSNDLKLILAADDAFHRTLLKIAGVPGTWRYVCEAREMHRRVRALSRMEYDSVRRSVAQHASIVADLAAGRTSLAIEHMRGHIRMNVALAEDIANKHSEYFIAKAPETSYGHTPAASDVQR